jgi:hypothetical protein
MCPEATLLIIPTKILKIQVLKQLGFPRLIYYSFHFDIYKLWPGFMKIYSNHRYPFLISWRIDEYEQPNASMG